MIGILIFAVAAVILALAWRAGSAGGVTAFERAYAYASPLPLLISFSPAFGMIVGGERAVAGWASLVSRVGIGLSAILIVIGVVLVARAKLQHRTVSPAVFLSAVAAGIPAAMLVFWMLVWR